MSFSLTGINIRWQEPAPSEQKEMITLSKRKYEEQNTCLAMLKC